MKQFNQLVYIISHKQDDHIAQKLERQLNETGIVNRIFSQQGYDEVKESAINCDAVVVVLSKHLKNSEPMKDMLNLLTAKKTISYITDDTKFDPGDSIMYYIQKTQRFDGRNEAAGFIDAVKELLETVKMTKDALIITDKASRDNAKKTVKRLAANGFSSVVYLDDAEYIEPMEHCQVVVAAGIDKSEAYTKIKNEASGYKKKVIIVTAQDMNSAKRLERFVAKTVSSIIKVKPPARVILADNMGGLKLMKKPWAHVISALIFVQVFVFLLWLTSKQNIFFGALLIVAVAAYVIFLTVNKKRCALRRCRNRHNGKKVEVNINNQKTYVQRFCTLHDTTVKISADSKAGRLAVIAVAVVTAVFAVFLLVADVKASDFTFLDLRQQIASARQAEFTDPGFEAFVRNSFDLGDDPISCGTLMDVTELRFNSEDMTQPIESLEDLKYFPNLTVFDCMGTNEVSGDFSSFEYTPKLKHLWIDRNNIYGDIAGLSGMTELEEFQMGDWEGYSPDQLFGDISVFKDMPMLRILLIPLSRLGGDIEALRGKDMDELELACPDVHGDLSSVADMDNLVYLSLYLADLSGDISLLDNMNDLQILSLGVSRVSGDISVLSDLDLELLDLGDCNVYGNISVLQNMTSLTVLALFENGVTGDISALRNLSGLYSLRMDGTGVTGDVAVFENTPNLESLMLDQTGVYGDPSVFDSLENLIQWSCNNTNVSIQYAQDFNADPMNVARTVLIDPSSRWAEGVRALANSGGHMFGDVDIKRPSADGSYFQFISQENAAWMPHSFKLLPENNNDYCGNAFMIKFQPKQVENLGFHFVGEDSIAVSFDDNNRPCFVNEQSGETYPFSDFASSDVALQPDKWYFALIALKTDGRFRSVVWEDGKAEERAIFETQLNDLGIKVGESGWEVVIAFDAGGTFNMESYWLLDNTGFTNSITTDASGPMNTVRTILNDPQVIFSEDAAAMDANGGENFGDVAVKQLSEDGSCYQFISDDDGAYMIGNVNFLDLGEFRGDAQAVLIKFQPEAVDGLSFTLFDNGEIVLSFEDGRPHLIHVQDSYKAPYSDYMETDLTLQSSRWYWALMAFDANGYYRSLVWEDGKAEEAAYCAENMGDWHPGYMGSNWHLTIGFGSNETLNVMEYRILDFNGYIQVE